MFDIKPDPQTPFYDLAVDFNTQIAAGGNSEKDNRNGTGNVLWITSLIATFFFDAAQSSGIIYTPLLRTPSPTIGSNTMPSIDSMRIEWTVNQMKFASNPIRGSLAFGNATDPLYLPVQIPLKPGDQVKVKAYNDSNFTVMGQFIFRGILQDDRQAA